MPRIYNLRSPEQTGELLKVERAGNEYRCTVKLDGGETLTTTTGSNFGPVWCPVTGGGEYRKWLEACAIGHNGKDQAR